MSEITKLSAKKMAEKLENKDISSFELTTEHIKSCEKNKDINAFITDSFETALEEAKKVDSLRAKGEKLPKLAGVPIAIKDNISTKGIRTTAASKILDNYVPVYDATVVQKVKAHFMPILGKTNLDEFAMGSSNEHSAYGVVKNPVDKTRVPGGSGGGSASAVASFCTPFALGSDTGGSIRQPASFTGTVGAKPTYGGVSRYGLIALSSSLDQIGPVSRNVMDAALLSDVIYGYDDMDSTSLQKMSSKGIVDSVIAAERDFKNNKIKGLKVGIVKEITSGEMSKGFQKDVLSNFKKTVDSLEKKGVEIIEVSCPHFEYGFAAYYLIQPSEASSNLARYDSVRYGQIEKRDTILETMAATRGKYFGDEVKRRIILGTYALSAGYYDAYYNSATKVRTLIQKDFENAYKKVDVLISPTCPTTAFKIGERSTNPLQMYLNDIATIPSNLAGVPGISVPDGVDSNGLPIGCHILAPIMDDKKMFYVGRIVEMLKQ